MAEANLFTYSFKELAALMVKDQGIHEGLWGVYVRFGIHAANAGPSDNDMKPTALIPIVEIGLQRFEQLNALSVDASVENPVAAKSAKDNAMGVLALGKAKRKS